MRPTCYLLLAVSVVACGPPARKQAPTASSSAPAAPFEDVKPSDKILMGRWGTIVVAGEYQDDASSPIALPKGTTLDIAYVRRNEGSDVDGRFAIGHEEAPGATTPEPEVKGMPGAAVATTTCPHLTTSSGDLVTKDGQKGRYACGESSLGSGIVATLRKGDRVYHLVCLERGANAVAACIGYAQTFAPN